MSFERFAGLSAVLAAAAGLMYAVSFIVLQNALLSGLFLLIGGLLSTPVLIAVYGRLRDAANGTGDAGFAAWAIFLAVFGLLGSAIHGGYDLANAINPPVATPGSAGLPSQVDPRGLLTFGVTGLALLVIAWLIERSERFPRRLGLLGYVLAVLMIVLYVGRLVILDTTSPLIVVPALLAGFLISPVWYAWLGISLLGSRQPESNIRTRASLNF